MTSLRHLGPAFALAAVLCATGAALDALARASPGSGVVWVVTAGRASDVNRILAVPGTRLGNFWAGARVLELRVDSLRQVQVPEGSALVALHLPWAELSMPACQ